MTEQVSGDSPDIRDTDIVFDCPYCGKSLAIDYRGVGLTVPCSDCGRRVQVPIPEGMELSDLDSSREEQEARIVNLRNVLAETQARNRELDDALDALGQRYHALEKEHLDNRHRAESIGREIEVIRAALRQVEDGLLRITGLIQGAP